MASVTPPLDMANSSAASTAEYFNGTIEKIELVFYILLMVTAFIANIVAISTILRTKALRANPHNLLILNLNVIDLGITLLSMTFSVGSFFDDGAALKNSYTLCRFNGLFAMTCTVGNFTTTFCIAIDRYITVVWSTRFPNTKMRVYILLAYSWIVSFTFALFPTAEILSKFVYTPATHHCSPAWNECAYYITWFVHIYGVTVPVMTVCYAFVFRAIRQKENRLRGYGVGKKGTPAPSSESGTVTAAGPLPAKSLQTVDQSCENSFSQSEVVASRYYRKRQDTKELPSNVSTSDMSPHAENNLRVENQFQLAIRPNASEPYLPTCTAEEQAPTKKEVTLTRSVSLKDPASAPEDRGGHRDGRNRWSFRRDFRNKFAIGFGSPSSGSDAEKGYYSSEGTLGSSNDESSKMKKKEKRRMLRMQNLSVDKQVAFTGVLLVLTTIICWTPYNIIHSCFLDINLNHHWESLAMLLGYLNALLDPLIYTFMNRKARAARSEYTRGIMGALQRLRYWCADGVGDMCEGIGMQCRRERDA